MNPGDFVVQRLKADLDFMRLVDGRVYPGIVAQDSPLPAVVYNVIDELVPNSLQGDTCGFKQAHVQIDAYDKSYLKAQEVGKAIHAVLGSICSSGTSSVRVMRRDSYEDDTELYRVSQDFSLWLEE